MRNPGTNLQQYNHDRYLEGVRSIPPLRLRAFAWYVRVWGSMAIPLVLLLSCSSHPEIIANRFHIWSTSANTERIRIPALPIADYPLLSRFERVKEIDFHWEGANDTKLRELSKLSFTNLQGIALLDCPAVTDDGIRAIAKIPSIRGLALEGTSITDVGVEVMATQMNLTSVNVANCKFVTREGIQTLARSPSLRRLFFSADGWTDEQVIDLLSSLKSVNWCGIVDSKRQLNASTLVAKGRSLGIHVVVKATGALQDSPNPWR